MKCSSFIGVGSDNTPPTVLVPRRARSVVVLQAHRPGSDAAARRWRGTPLLLRSGRLYEGQAAARAGTYGALTLPGKLSHQCVQKGLQKCKNNYSCSCTSLLCKQLCVLQNDN